MIEHMITAHHQVITDDKPLQDKDVLFLNDIKHFT